MFSTHHLGEYFSVVETSLIIFPLGLAKQVGKSKPGPPLGLLFSRLVDVLVCFCVPQPRDEQLSSMLFFFSSGRKTLCYSWVWAR